MWRSEIVPMTTVKPLVPDAALDLLWRKARSFCTRQQLLEERCRMQVIAVGAECDRWRVNK